MVINSKKITIFALAIEKQQNLTTFFLISYNKNINHYAQRKEKKRPQDGYPQA